MIGFIKALSLSKKNGPQALQSPLDKFVFPLSGKLFDRLW